MKNFYIKLGASTIALLLILVISLFSCSDSLPVFSEQTTGGETESETVAEPVIENKLNMKVGISVSGETIYARANLDEEELFFFLPSYFTIGEWNLTEDILLNGVKIKDGDKISREEMKQGFKLSFESGETLNVVAYFGSDIPSMFLDSDDGDFAAINNSPDHSYSVSGDISLLSGNGDLLYSGRVKKIRGRGNSTWNVTEKKPYQIQLEKAVSILGLAKNKKYVLLANYYDPSHMRNAVALKLASLAMDDYSPNFAYVDLYLCGEYAGVYLLCEKIEIGEGIVDIADMETMNENALGDIKPDSFARGGVTDSAKWGSTKWYELPKLPLDITGGYLLEVDFPERYGDEASGFVTNRGLPVTIKSPQYAAREQVEYISEYFCDFEDAVYSKNGVNAKGKHYSEYADVESLAFRYLFEEYVLNIDGGIASFVIYKDSEANGGKLKFSCVWDYDCALGNYNKYADLTNPEILFVAASETRNNGTVPSLFNALMKHRDFAESVAKYYTEHFFSALGELPKYITEVYSQIEESVKMDELIYQDFESRNFYGADSGKNYHEAYEYLSDFVSKRILFFDNLFKVS